MKAKTLIFVLLAISGTCYARPLGQDEDIIETTPSPTPTLDPRDDAVELAVIPSPSLGAY